MSGLLFFISVLCLGGAAVAALALWAKKNEKKNVMKVLVWGFVIFFGCFCFPISSERFPAKWYEYLWFLNVYIIVAIGLYGLYGEDRGPFLFPRLVFFTALGMVCRYLLEFGEVSNTYNFTVVNIVTYLFAAPVVTLLVYEFADKLKNHEE